MDPGVRHRTLAAMAENGVARRRMPPSVGQRQRRRWMARDGLEAPSAVWSRGGSGRGGRENRRGGKCAEGGLTPSVLRLLLPAQRVS